MPSGHAWWVGMPSSPVQPRQLSFPEGGSPAAQCVAPSLSGVLQGVAPSEAIAPGTSIRGRAVR